MRLPIVALLAVLAGCGSGNTVPGDPAGPDDPDPPPLGTLPAVGGCQVFPADNAWNRDISAAPVHARSDELLAAMLPDHALHLDLGTTEAYYGIPYTVVTGSQPLVPITYGTGGADYSDESDPGPMPIPRDAPIEGGSPESPDPPSGDRHVLVVRQSDCLLFELFNAERTSDGFRVSSSAIWDLTVNHSRPPGWTSADAAGLPILPGLLKYDEVEGDRLHHALRFTVPRVRRAYVPPASHCGQWADASLPPYGTRVRLRGNVDLSGYSGDALVILRAMQRYGLILADQGSAWYVTGTSHPRWAAALAQLRERPVRGSDFEVIEAGPLTLC